MPTFPNRTHVKSVVLLAILLPFVSLSQVKIREKVEIKPIPARARLLSGETDSTTTEFYNPPTFIQDEATQAIALTLPASLTISLEGVISFGGLIGSGQQVQLVAFMNDDWQPSFAWKGRYSSGAGGGAFEGQQPFTYAFNKGTIPDVRMYLFDWQWADGTRQISYSPDVTAYGFTGSLRQGILSTSPPPVSVTATASARGLFLPNVTFSGWQLYANNNVIQCNGSMGIGMIPVDGNGDMYEPFGIPRSKAAITVRVDSGGPYVFLRTPRGIEDTVVSTTLAEGCALVFDATRGGFMGDIREVLVTVSGGGKKATMGFTLVCDRLNHFQVTAVPRVLAEGDTSAIAITAQDINNHEVTFTPKEDFNIMLTLSSPDVVFGRWGPPPIGRFILGHGDPQWPPYEVSYSMARDSGVKYLADDGILGSLDSMKVFIKAVKNGDPTKWGQTDVRIKNFTCVHVTFDSSVVAVGGRTGVTFTRSDGMPGGFPPDQKFVVRIILGVGKLVSGNDTGTVLYEAQAPVYYLAPGVLEGDSMIVHVASSAYPQSNGSSQAANGTAAGSLKKATQQAATQTMGGKKQVAFMQALSRLLANNVCEYGELLVENPELIVILPPEEIQPIKGDNPPTMPKPLVEAQLKHFSGDSVDFHWSATLKWTTAKGPWNTPSDGNESYEGQATGLGSNIVDLRVNFDHFGMRGGNQVTITVTATDRRGKIYPSKVIANPFTILGLNPAKSTILSELRDLKYKVIASVESNFNQFAPNSANENVLDKPDYPLQGGKTPADFGLMQVSRQYNESLTDDVVWNWKANGQAGKTIFDAFKNRSDTLHKTVGFIDKKGTMHLLFPGSTAPTEGVSLRNAYNLYNTGHHYYRWKLKDIRNPQTGYWQGFPPLTKPGERCYADKCMDLYSTHPSDWDN